MERGPRSEEVLFDRDARCRRRALLHDHHARRADLLLLLDHTLGDAALVGNSIRAKTHHVRRTGRHLFIGIGRR